MPRNPEQAYDDWRMNVSYLTQMEEFRKLFFEAKQQQAGIAPFALRMEPRPLPQKKRLTQKTLVLVMVTGGIWGGVEGAEDAGGHHYIQIAERGEKLRTVDSLENMGEMVAPANEKEDIQTDMNAGDLLCHQYSLCEALHFVDPARYSKPDWQKGIHKAWIRAYRADEIRSTAASRAKLAEEERKRDIQKIHNFTFILKTIKLLVKEPFFPAVFNATYHSYDARTRKIWLTQLKKIINAMRPGDVTHFEPFWVDPADEAMWGDGF